MAPKAHAPVTSSIGRWLSSGPTGGSRACPCPKDRMGEEPQESRASERALGVEGQKRGRLWRLGNFPGQGRWLQLSFMG